MASASKPAIDRVCLLKSLRNASGYSARQEIAAMREQSPTASPTDNVHKHKTQYLHWCHQLVQRTPWFRSFG
eukprot:2731329-Amphidinium_carterae.1